MSQGTKIHLGCGKRFLPGFVHVDIDEHPHIDHKHAIDTLPMFEDDSASLIYSSHNFEYFDRQKGAEVLREWKRVLEPGGTLRLAVPDFAGIVAVYLKYKDLEHSGILGPLFGRWEVNQDGQTSYIYHKTVYDFDSLKNLLESEGFKNVRRYDPDEVWPADYDDHSKAYVPHMDKSGIAISLNVEADK